MRWVLLPGSCMPAEKEGGSNNIIFEILVSALPFFPLSMTVNGNYLQKGTPDLQLASLCLHHPPAVVQGTVAWHTGTQPWRKA